MTQTESNPLNKINYMPSKLSELLIDESFVRFLNGNETKEEHAQWTAWLKQDKEHEKLMKISKELMLKGSQSLPMPNSAAELERLMWRIDSQNRYESYRDARKSSRTMVWSAIAVAASILLVIGFFAQQTLLQNNSEEESRVATVTYRTLNTETGQKTSVQYSDGSQIVLNANSQLYLPAKMINSDTMQVWLKGEAFFNIANDPSSKRTFIVHTPDGDVSVLGTIFSVNTIKSRSQVVLSEGKVRVDVIDSLNQTDLEYTMKPGELIQFSQHSDKFEVREVNAQVYTSWASDTLVLDNTPLSELVERIEFTYNVTVEITDNQLLQQRLTGRLENLNIDFLLEGLAQALDADITMQGKTVFIRKKQYGSVIEGS